MKINLNIAQLMNSRVCHDPRCTFSQCVKSYGAIELNTEFLSVKENSGAESFPEMQRQGAVVLWVLTLPIVINSDLACTQCVALTLSCAK